MSGTQRPLHCFLDWMERAALLTVRQPKGSGNAQ
jgi:hypothetical protein